MYEFDVYKEFSTFLGVNDDAGTVYTESCGQSLVTQENNVKR